MSWSMLTVRENEDDGDGVLYPLPTLDVNGILLDGDDGECAPLITATTVHLQERGQQGRKNATLLKAAEIKASINITDARVAIACTKYDKGGGWIGGPTALAANAVSKARAAVRRRGKSLVGHIRYPWLWSVGYIEKTGWLSDEQLRLVAIDKTGSEKRILLLDLTLPKSTSAEKVAREIVQRAAGTGCSAPGSSHRTSEKRSRHCWTLGRCPCRGCSSFPPLSSSQPTFSASSRGSRRGPPGGQPIPEVGLRDRMSHPQQQVGSARGQGQPSGADGNSGRHMARASGGA